MIRGIILNIEQNQSYYVPRKLYNRYSVQIKSRCRRNISKLSLWTSTKHISRQITCSAFVKESRKTF